MLVFQILLDCLNHKKPIILSAHPELCQTLLSKNIPVKSGMSPWDQLQNLSQLNMAPTAFRSVRFELKFSFPTLSGCPKCCFHGNLAMIIQGWIRWDNLDQQMKVWGTSWGLEHPYQAPKLPLKTKGVPDWCEGGNFCKRFKKQWFKVEIRAKTKWKFFTGNIINCQTRLPQEGGKFQLGNASKKKSFKNLIFCSYLLF